MKRADNLAPLSRDHHHALVVAKRLLSHASDTDDGILQAYWRTARADLLTELSEHFRCEEHSFGVLLKGEYKQRLFADHQHLCELLLEDSCDAALQFARCLKAHVRFEERELFNWLQEHHPDLALEA